MNIFCGLLVLTHWTCSNIAGNYQHSVTSSGHCVNIINFWWSQPGTALSSSSRTRNTATSSKYQQQLLVVKWLLLLVKWVNLSCLTWTMIKTFVFTWYQDNRSWHLCNVDWDVFDKVDHVNLETVCDTEMWFVVCDGVYEYLLSWSMVRHWTKLATILSIKIFDSRD